ncbi:unnamed protein product [Rhizophagus irregularis]|nr:unnamed protein product [Rhizophagus irregularis]
MPVQLSTILYISEYREKTPVFTLLAKIGRRTSLIYCKFKFGIGPVDNQIDTQLILTFANILPIKPEDLPIHHINVVGKLWKCPGIIFTAT